MSATTAAIVHVDIVDVGRALVTGPGFSAYVGRVHGARSSTGRPTQRIYIEDDGGNGGREPMPRKEVALRKGFPAAARSLACDLAAHYRITDPVIELDDETGTYTLPEV